MSNERKFQPALESLPIQLTQARHAYVRTIVTLFVGADAWVLEQLEQDLMQFTTTQVDNNLSQEMLVDLQVLSQLVALKGWSVFLDIDIYRLTAGVEQLRVTHNLSIGAAATLFFTRAIIEPYRAMMKVV